jgi:MFS family permease
MKDPKKKTVRLFAWASFLNDLGSDMIYPIWPLFVTTILGANMAALGFIDGLGDAIVSISQALSGYWSDKIKKRKIFIVIGYMCGSLSRIGYALSTVWQHLIPIRILDRAGKIRSAPRDAIIADISTKENRGANFGLLRAMDNLGAIFGIVISIILMNILSLRTIFYLAAIPSMIAVLLIAVAVKEKKTDGQKIFKGVRFKDFDKNFRFFLVLSAIFSLGSFSYSFLLIYAKEYGIGVSAIPAMYLLFTGVAFLVSIPFGRLSDKIGRKVVVIISFILWGLTCLAFILSHSYVAFIISFALYGAHRGAIEAVQKAFVSELAPPEYRASALGGYQMVIGLCALPASLMAGLLWESIGIQAPFILAIGLTLISGLMLARIK